MLKSVSVSSLCACLGLSVSTAVADVNQSANRPSVFVPTTSSIYDWTGPYLGAQSGWGWSDIDNDELGFDVEVDGDGLIWGLTAGYLWDFGSIAIGGEFQYDRGDLEFDRVDGVTAGLDVGAIRRVKAVAGVEAQWALLFASVGWTDATAEIDGQDFSDDGFVLGAGVDYWINERASAGFEILHHRYNEFDDTGFDARLTTLQARIGFRF